MMKETTSRNSHWIWSVGLALLVSSMTALPFSASALDLVVEQVSLQSSASQVTTGEIAVYLDLGPDEPAPEVSGWSAAVTIAGATGIISFTSPFALSADGAIHPPLIGENFAPLGGVGTARSGASAFVSGGGSVVVTDGAGLFRVPFAIVAGGAGTFPISIDLDATGLVDNGVQPVPFNPVNGTLTVSTTTVPVPSLQKGGLIALALIIIGIGSAALKSPAPRPVAS